MAFNNPLSAHLDELRSPNGSSRHHVENGSNGQNTPSFRYSGSFISTTSQQQQQQQPAPAPPPPIEPPSLQRRFTTDLTKMQPSAALTQPPSAAGVPNDLTATMLKKAQLLEKKKQEYEMAAEQRKQFQAQLQLITQQEAREKQELEQITRDLQRAGINPGGYQSEPTTPPEPRDTQFSSVFPRKNRYSTSSFASPTGNTRSSRSGSQLASPPSELANMPGPFNNEGIPSRSVPSSRRGSNDIARNFIPETFGAANRNTGSSNRYSMPVGSSRVRLQDSIIENGSNPDLEQVNTTSFLFDDDEKTKDNLASPDVPKYFQMTDNNFPVLIRQSEAPGGGTLSASSAALDLASSQPTASDTSPSDVWSSPQRNRLSLQHGLNQDRPSNIGQSNDLNAQLSPEPTPFAFQPNSHRHSMEANLMGYSHTKPAVTSGSNEFARPSLLTNSHTSYSTNDIPTLNNGHGAHVVTPPKGQSQFQAHNANLGRIPMPIFSRQAFDPGSSTHVRQESKLDNNNPLKSAPAKGPPIIPPTTASIPQDTLSKVTEALPNAMSYPTQPFYPGYNVQMMNTHTNMLPQNALAFQSPMQMYQQQNGFVGYNNYPQQARFPDPQARPTSQRRVQYADEQGKFANANLDTMRGEILGLCKDQHGCRFLQKKLEEGDPDVMQTIFEETHEHVVELMIDPFGNYLCQKLLEYSSDDQRTVLINQTAPEMVKIALNSHGTRALQKMIEFVNTREQIQTVIDSLNNRVVELIQDLNGNHVIQKCLNRLSPEDAQFIFDAVGLNCVTVGTHRHGCCVLQRCIDHASGNQKAELIAQITDHAFHLVQDPFGNYVLQYIIDLQEPCFTDPLCQAFHGQVPQLSKQKFSSNVIEKCLRGAETNVARVMIEEMLNANELEKMLRDGYANYVVQTAIDYADAETKASLIEAIRPLLPAVRQTPHGRRIQSKIMTIENQSRTHGTEIPNDRNMTNGQLPGTITANQSAPLYQAQANMYSPLANNRPGNFASPFGQNGTDHLTSPTGYGHLPAEPFPRVQNQFSFTSPPQTNGGFF